MLRRSLWLFLVVWVLAGCASTAPDQPALNAAPAPTVTAQNAVVEISYPEGTTEYVSRAEFEQLRDKLAPGIPEEEALNELASRKLLLHEAQVADFTPDPAELDEAYTSVTTQTCQAPEIQQQLPPGTQGLTGTAQIDACAQVFGFANGQAIRDFLGNQLLINRVIRTNAVGNEVHAAHILLLTEPLPEQPSVDPAATPEATAAVTATATLSETIQKRKVDIEQIYAQVVQNPERFGEIADERTEDPSGKGKGGDLGFFGEDVQFVPEFKAAVFALKDGEISQPILTQFGWHIIKRIETRKAEQPTQEQATAYQQKILDDAKAAGRVKFLITPAAPPTEVPQVQLPPAETEPQATPTITQ